MDGQANAIDNLDIDYTYHEHTGNSNIVGGCYGKQLTKVACGAERIFPGWDENVICCKNSTYLGGTCTWYYADKKSWVEEQWNKGLYYGACTNPLDGYTIALICGKTTSTVESVTIKY